MSKSGDIFEIARVGGLTLIFTFAVLAVCASTDYSQGGTIGGSNPGQVNGIELFLSRNPNSRLYGDDSFLSPASLCRQWMQNKGTLEQLMVAASALANSSGRLPKGVSIVRQSATLSTNCSAIATQPTGFLEIDASLPRSQFVFNLTTPGPLPQSFDPRIAITFDLIGVARAAIPTSPRQIALGPASLMLRNVRVEGRNLTGDVAIDIAKLITFLTGRDYLSEITRQRQFDFPGAKAGLGQFGQALANAGAKLPSITTEFDVSRKVLIFRGPGGADDRCVSGYVWRNARSDDHVCVIPTVRAQTADDNAHKKDRWIHDIQSGPATGACLGMAGQDFQNCVAKLENIPCKSGFVWRDAFPDDYVCVLPATRAQAKRDNAAARSRRVDAPDEVIH